MQDDNFYPVEDEQAFTTAIVALEDAGLAFNELDVVCVDVTRSAHAGLVDITATDVRDDYIFKAHRTDDKVVDGIHAFLNGQPYPRLGISTADALIMAILQARGAFIEREADKTVIDNVYPIVDLDLYQTLITQVAEAGGESDENGIVFKTSAPHLTSGVYRLEHISTEAGVALRVTLDGERVLNIPTPDLMTGEMILSNVLHLKTLYGHRVANTCLEVDPENRSPVLSTVRTGNNVAKLYNSGVITLNGPLVMILTGYRTPEEQQVILESILEHLSTEIGI